MRLGDRLKELAFNLDEMSRLAIDKNIPQWRNQPRHGIFMDPAQVSVDSLALLTLLNELLTKYSDIQIELRFER